MKIFAMTVALVFVAGCVDLEEHLAAEREWHMEHEHMEDGYDLEYLDDCAYYEELDCG